MTEMPKYYISVDNP